MIFYEDVGLAEFQHASHFALAKLAIELLCPQANYVGLGTFCLYKQETL